MKAWRVHKWGDMVFDTDVPVPEPGEGQVRIRHRAAALNFFDLLLVDGKYQYKPPFPFIPGSEVAGVVDAVGPGVDSLQPGDPVAALPHFGGYAEYSVADQKRTFRLPAGLGFAEAASMPVVYQTSWFALDLKAHLEPSEWLLVHAGASGVGMSAIQIGKALGANVIATAGSEDKLNFCHRLGADYTLSYSDPAWVDRVKEITVRGADVIYDPVGGDIFDLSTKCIAPEGRLLVIGFASGRIPTLAMNRVLLKNMSVVGVFWGGHTDLHPNYASETQQKLFHLFEERKIVPLVSNRYPLAEAPRAMQDLAARKVFGKAVLEME